MTASFAQANQVLNLIAQHKPSSTQVQELIQNGDLLKILLEHPDLRSVDRSGFERSLRKPNLKAEEKTTSDPIELSSSQRNARNIMGSNFIGPDEVAEHLGVRFTSAQLQVLSIVPYSEDVLHNTKSKYLLFPGYPFSLTELIEKFRYTTPIAGWLDDKRYPTYRVELSWHLISKRALPGSVHKTYFHQLHLLEFQNDYEVPRASELVYMYILSRLARNERLFQRELLNCADLSSLGYNIRIGDDGRGLYIGNGWMVDKYVSEGDKEQNTGLAVAISPS